MNNFTLTDKDYKDIFERAHRQWLDASGKYKTRNDTDKYMLAKAYFDAVVAFLLTKGYTIRKDNVEK